MATSSAKIFIGDDTTDGRSLIYKMKSKGSNIEPCGTPERKGDHAVRSTPIDNYMLSSC